MDDVTDEELIAAYIATKGVNKMPGCGEGWHFLYCDDDRALSRRAKSFKKHRFKKHRATASVKQAQALSLRTRGNK